MKVQKRMEGRETGSNKYRQFTLQFCFKGKESKEGGSWRGRENKEVCVKGLFPSVPLGKVQWNLQAESE